MICLRRKPARLSLLRLIMDNLPRFATYNGRDNLVELMLSGELVIYGVRRG